MTYETSVLQAADDLGNLSYNNAVKLLGEHGFTMDDMYADPRDISPIELDNRNAHALLLWLGY